MLHCTFVVGDAATSTISVFPLHLHLHYLGFTLPLHLYSFKTYSMVSFYICVYINLDSLYILIRIALTSLHPRYTLTKLPALYRKVNNARFTFYIHNYVVPVLTFVFAVE